MPRGQFSAFSVWWVSANRKANAPRYYVVAVPSLMGRHDCSKALHATRVNQPRMHNFAPHEARMR